MIEHDISPRSILMIKAHSAGIGDVLRSSAAWRTIKNKWPHAKLHLVFLTKFKGYAVEELMQHHHLLSSSHFIAIKSGSPHVAGAKNLPIKGVLEQVKKVCAETRPDLIIDFEASGLRTSIITHTAARVSGSKSVGIASFWGRRFFYSICAPSVKDYAQKHGLSLPMDYTERDYVALASLGISRQGQAIELQVSPEGAIARQRLETRIARQSKEQVVIGLNIGCGTPDALHKRPNLEIVAQALGSLYAELPHTLVLTGAPFEKDVNEAFITAYSKKWGNSDHIIDWAGQTSISGLTGVIDAVDMLISTDSGPYHMAVALRKPTLVLFTYTEATSFHEVLWCQRLIAPYRSSDIVKQFQKLQNYKNP